MKKRSTYFNNKKLILLTLLMLLSVGQGFANSKDYYAKLTATTSATGKGLVYAAANNTAPTADSQYKASVDATGNNSSTGNSASVSFYAWAKPARGYVFDSWSTNNASVSGNSVTISASSENSNSPTTGTITANWKDAPSYTITYKQPENNGQYSVRYDYTTIVNNAFTAGSESYTMSASTADKAVKSYTADKVTLSTSSQTFLGWYEGETLLSKDKTCVYGITKNTTISARFANPDEKHTINFIAPSNGTIKATDGTTTITNKGSITSNKAFTLTATPNSGYHVVGWYTTKDGGKTKEYFSYDAEVSNYNFYENVSVGCDFSNKSKAQFQIKGNTSITYDDLNKANEAANGGVIVLIGDGELLAGDYTISKGNTLLIPYDDAYTVKTTKAEVTQTWAALKAYKTLTLASGANITVVNGAAINVGGKQFSTSNQMGSAGGPGTPTGPYGCIDMSKGGNITLQSGSNLYAWGFITGQNMDEGNNTTGVGTIDAQNGATVYEDIVIADWHGGSATSGMNSKKKYFPFNQYFIPNIEVPLTINYGATLNTVSDISAGIGNYKSPYSVPITFIGKTGGLFNMQSSSSTAKIWYDATTDEQHFEFTGDNTIEGISANVGGYVTVDASKYVMPMTSNFNIHIKSGSLTVPSDIALLPGAKVTLDEGVDATISQGVNVYIYDLDNWGLYAYNNYRKVYTFRPTKFKKYGQGDKNTKAADVAKVTGLSDAKLVVNGKLTVNGAIYTTNAGADICSDKGGSIVFASAPTASATTYQYVHGGNPTDVSIPVTAAQLHNASDALNAYTATTGSAANTTFTYKNHVWTSEAAPTFELAGNKLSLTNAYPVTADEVKNNATSKTYLSVDLTNANGPLGDAATLKNNVGAKTGNNILLYVSKNDAGTNITNTDAENVVVKDSKKTYTASNFVITDKQPIDVPTAFTATKASYSRTNTKNSGDTQWGTICLPFELTSGNGIQYYQLSGISGSTMTFTKVDKVPANTPAIYSVASGVKDLAITGSGTNIAVTPTESSSSDENNSGFTLVGVQKKTETLTDGSNNYYIAQNKFWKPTGTDVNVRPQRAYFKTNGAESLAKVFSIVADETTGITSPDYEGNAPTVVGIYSVNGMRQDGLRPGINIVKMSDGSSRKVVIR